MCGTVDDFTKMFCAMIDISRALKDVKGVKITSVTFTIDEDCSHLERKMTGLIDLSNLPGITPP